MTNTRRHLISLACASALGLAAASASTAASANDNFPTRPVTLVVPFATGGPTDSMARTLANALKDRLGQPVIVDNRAGAGGNVGAAIVANAAADGYTILFGTSGPLAINVSLFSKVNYDPVRSFAPIIRVGHLPNVLVVHPSVPAKTVAELIAHGKANPGKLTFASSGNGASSHLAGVLFNNMAGTDFVHVPYRGTGPALADLLGGQVTMTFTDVLTAAPYVKSDKLRALGVTTLQKSGAMPDVPTVAEQGLKDFDVSVFFGIVAPAATPAPVVAKLNKAFNEVLQQPDVRKTLTAQGLEFATETRPEDLGTFIKTEVTKWADVVKSSGARID